MSSNPAHDEEYLIQFYVIKCACDLQQDGDFLFQFPPTYKTDRHDITEKLFC